MYGEHNVQKTQFSQWHPCASGLPAGENRSYMNKSDTQMQFRKEGSTQASTWVTVTLTPHAGTIVCAPLLLIQLWTQSPPVCLPPPHPISTPQRKLVHHVGFDAPWRGRVCTAALLCLVLHNMSWGIDIPPSLFRLPPSLFSSGAALPLPAHYFEGLKKAAGGVKIAAPALPCLGAACLPAATPEYQQDPPQPLSQQPGCCCIPISPTEAPTPTKALQARGKINKTKRIWWAADKEHNVFISWYLKDLRFRLTCIAWAVIWEGKQLLKDKDTTSNLY